MKNKKEDLNEIFERYKKMQDDLKMVFENDRMVFETSVRLTETKKNDEKDSNQSP